MNIGTGTISDTVSTTYLSSEETLRNINQEFSSLEQGLQEEMESVKETGVLRQGGCAIVFGASNAVSTRLSGVFRFRAGGLRQA